MAFCRVLDQCENVGARGGEGDHDIASMAPKRAIGGADAIEKCTRALGCISTMNRMH